MSGRARVLMWCAVGLALAPAALPATFPTKTVTDLIGEAELIFEGVVADVTERVADVRGPADVALPHTFVTYRIEHVIKGAAAEGDRITLRFVGGHDGRGRILQVAGIPRFGPGDRDVLFVTGNGSHWCPLVGWEQGRLRLVRDAPYDEFGRDLWWTPRETFWFGQRRLDLRAWPYPPLQIESAETPPEPPAGSRRPDAAGLRTLLSEVARARAAGEAPRAPVASAPLGVPFHFPRLPAVPPPASNDDNGS